jgi:S1-C subfamily serine protease
VPIDGFKATAFKVHSAAWPLISYSSGGYLVTIGAPRTMKSHTRAFSRASAVAVAIIRSLVCRTVVIIAIAFVVAIADSAAAMDPDWAACVNSITPDAKIDACTRVINRDNQSIEDRVAALNNRGNSYNSKGEFDRAISDFTEAVRLNPAAAGPYYNRGNSYYGKGEFDRAIADFSQAIRLSPNLMAAYVYRGQMYNLKGDYDRALADFNRAVRLDPTEVVIYSNRGISYRGKGDYARAILELNNALRLDPAYTAAYTIRGLVYLDQGERKRAQADFEAALRLPPKFGNGKWAHDMARTQLALLRPAKEPPAASSGSGFFVTHQGHILTNAHVVKDCIGINVRLVDGNTTSARLVGENEADDLALLKAEAHVEEIATLRVGSAPRTGDPIVVFGFPLSGLLASTGNATTGNVTALAGLRDDLHQLQISAPVQPGNSGGPVVDMSGNVIGVVVSKLNALRVARITEDIPQNINFAIKTSIALKFLDARGVHYSSSMPSAEMSIPNIVERVRLFSVEVRCER